MDEVFEALLTKIREDRLPAYGSLRWDGQHRLVTETFRLQQPGDPPGKREARNRLLRYLENLTSEERAVVDIAIETKDEAPYLLKITGKTSELPPARLAELRRRAA